MRAHIRMLRWAGAEVEAGDLNLQLDLPSIVDWGLPCRHRKAAEHAGRREFMPHLRDHPGACFSKAVQEWQHRQQAAEGRCSMDTRHQSLTGTEPGSCAFLKAGLCIYIEE